MNPDEPAGLMALLERLARRPAVSDATSHPAPAQRPPDQSFVERLSGLLSPAQPPAETTRLNPLQEKIFKQWARSLGIENPDDPRELYDYRGAFLAGANTEINPTDSLPHWPDTWKRHGHPTFSVESQYSAQPFDGGFWRGEQYTPKALTPADSAEARSAWAGAHKRLKPMGRAK